MYHSVRLRSRPAINDEEGLNTSDSPAATEVGGSPVKGDISGQATAPVAVRGHGVHTSRVRQHGKMNIQSSPIRRGQPSLNIGEVRPVNNTAVAIAAEDEGMSLNSTTGDDAQTQKTKVQTPQMDGFSIWRHLERQRRSRFKQLKRAASVLKDADSSPTDTLKAIGTVRDMLSDVAGATSQSETKTERGSGSARSSNQERDVQTRISHNSNTSSNVNSNANSPQLGNNNSLIQNATAESSPVSVNELRGNVDVASVGHIEGDSDTTLEKPQLVTEGEQRTPVSTVTGANGIFSQISTSSPQLSPEGRSQVKSDEKAQESITSGSEEQSDASTLGFLSVFEDEYDNVLLQSSSKCLQRGLSTLNSLLISQRPERLFASDKSGAKNDESAGTIPINARVEANAACKINTQVLIMIQGLLLLNYDSKLAFCDSNMFALFFKNIKILLTGMEKCAAERKCGTQEVEKSKDVLTNSEQLTLFTQCERIIVLMIECMEASVTDCCYANRKFESAHVLAKLSEVLQSPALKMVPSSNNSPTTKSGSNESEINLTNVLRVKGSKIKKKFFELIMLFLFPENEYPDWVENGRSSIGHKTKRLAKLFSPAAVDSLVKEAMKEAQRLKMANKV